MGRPINDGKTNDQRYREKHRESMRISAKKYSLKQKIKCFEFYSKGVPICDCCKEINIEFLTLDHINGGGNKHRKEIGTINIYRWAIKNNFPEGFRVLCMNCNWSLGKHGYCPHNKYKQC